MLHSTSALYLTATQMSSRVRRCFLISWFLMLIPLKVGYTILGIYNHKPCVATVCVATAHVYPTGQVAWPVGYIGSWRKTLNCTLSCTSMFLSLWCFTLVSCFPSLRRRGHIECDHVFFNQSLPISRQCFILVSALSFTSMLHFTAILDFSFTLPFTSTPRSHRVRPCFFLISFLQSHLKKDFCPDQNPGHLEKTFLSRPNPQTHQKKLFCPD